VIGRASSDGLASDELRLRLRDHLKARSGQISNYETRGHLDGEIFRSLGDLGVFRLRWDQGAGTGIPLARVMVEELALVNGGLALSVSLHSEIFINVLLRHGGDAHRELAVQAMDGRSIGCVALTEPGGGSNLAAVTSSAVRDGDGWNISLSKRYITNAGTATHCLALIRTGDSLSLFVIDLQRHRQAVRFIPTMGVRSADTCSIRIETHLPGNALVGAPNRGLAQLLPALDYERLLAAFGVVAVARHALRLTAAWLRDREQFGSRLIDHQALRHRLVDHWVRIEAADAMTGRASSTDHRGRLDHVDVAAAKLSATSFAGAALDDCIQMFGARGYTEAYPLERYFRDVRLARIGGGSDEMLRDIVSSAVDVHHDRYADLLSGMQSGENDMFDDGPWANEFADQEGRIS
jgi:alkylation response protein AidB-like acyl-CoA dehydrogenase